MRRNEKKAGRNIRRIGFVRQDGPEGRIKPKLYFNLRNDFFLHHSKIQT